MHERNGGLLIVEDDQLHRDTIKDIIQDAGYSVAGAANGQEAIDYLRTAPTPCLILLDLMMPIMNGWDFLAWLKKQPEPVASIPVAILSAADETRTRSVAAAYKTVERLGKPIELEALLGMVGKYC